MIKKLIIGFFLLAALLTCRHEAQIEVADVLSAYYTSSSLPAAIMGSTTAKHTGTWYAYGPSIWGQSDTVTEDHIFRIASMTKAIASVAAMQLVEKGLIKLDESLSELMPEMDSIPILLEDGTLVQSEHEITLRHLLSHTAGFGYGFTSARLAAFKPADWTYADNPRLFEPGVRWHYGTNTDWVGSVIEKISGEDLETYIRDNITGPLQMDHTWFNVPDTLQELIVSFGSRDSTGFRESPRIPESPVVRYSAGGGLFASPKDYLIFLKCMLNEGKYKGGQILKPETVDLLFENQLADGLTIESNFPDGNLVSDKGGFSDQSDTYGLAWAIEANKDESIRSQGTVYWAGIANSYYSLDRANQVALVYFTQFLPFNDQESYDFYRLYEAQVYANLRQR